MNAINNSDTTQIYIKLKYNIAVCETNLKIDNRSFVCRGHELQDMCFAQKNLSSINHANLTISQQCLVCNIHYLCKFIELGYIKVLRYIDKTPLDKEDIVIDAKYVEPTMYEKLLELIGKQPTYISSDIPMPTIHTEIKTIEGYKSEEKDNEKTKDKKWESTIITIGEYEYYGNVNTNALNSENTICDGNCDTCLLNHIAVCKIDKVNFPNRHNINLPDIISLIESDDLYFYSKKHIKDIYFCSFQCDSSSNSNLKILKNEISKQCQDMLKYMSDAMYDKT